MHLYETDFAWKPLLLLCISLKAGLRKISLLKKSPLISGESQIHKQFCMETQKTQWISQKTNRELIVPGFHVILRDSRAKWVHINCWCLLPGHGCIRREPSSSFFSGFCKHPSSFHGPYAVFHWLGNKILLLCTQKMFSLWLGIKYGVHVSQ